MAWITEAQSKGIGPELPPVRKRQMKCLSGRSEACLKAFMTTEYQRICKECTDVARLTEIYDDESNVCYA